jgi:predicted nuclease of predicted toxin-antitoxin system
LPGNERSRQRRKDALFFLDECLPAQVGEALALVEHPITTPDIEGNRGTPDEELIPWMARERLVWITKDFDAQKRHLAAILRYQISVVWIRGLERARNRLSIRQLHLMLTVKLPEIESIVRDARGPHHFEIHLSGAHPVLRPYKRDELERRQRERRRG